MMRPTVLLLVTIAFAGCRSAAPGSGPFGPTRVPPPSTGSYGAPNSYYQTPARQPSGQPYGVLLGDPATSLASNTLNATADVSADSSTGLNWQPVGSRNATNIAVDQTAAIGTGLSTQNSVAPARFNSRVNDAAASLSYNSDNHMGGTTPGSAYSKSLAQLSGMRVNDATALQLPEPGRFVPAEGLIEITQLPSAQTANITANGLRPSTTSVDSSATATADASSTSGQLRWRSR
jgi:hypothetical protein